MEKKSDVQQQQELLEKQINELIIKQRKLSREATALLNVDDDIIITRRCEGSDYEVQIPFNRYLDYERAGEPHNYYSTCLASKNKEVLATEMLRFSQRLIDAALQLRQIEG